MRARGGPRGGGAGGANHRGGRGSGRGGGGRGGGRGRTPSGPWSRLKPIELDPLEAIGLPSKGDNRLLDHKTQERYYLKIVERYMTFCSDAGERDELLRRFSSLQISEASPFSPSSPALSSPSSASFPRQQHQQQPRRHFFPGGGGGEDDEEDLLTPPPLDNYNNYNNSHKDGRDGNNNNNSNSPHLTPATAAALEKDTKGLSDVLAALRKLREGIVAASRSDDFAVQAYLFCIRLSVLVRHPESYHPAILHLLNRIHPSHSMTTVELSEVSGYLVLDTACRRNDLAEAYAMRRRHRLRDKRVDAVLAALSHDNYVAFSRLRHRVDGHKARLLEYAVPTMRRHLLKCFGRTYLSVDLAFLEESAGLPWEQLVLEEGVGWELETCTNKVVVRRVRAR